MASLLLASLTIPEIITFLRLAIIWAGVPALAVSALKIFFEQKHMGATYLSDPGLPHVVYCWST